MPRLFEDVRPGDIITADLINRIQREIERVSDGLSGIGTPSSGPRITGLLPATEVALGAELRILGTGFGERTSNVVTIDGVPTGTPKPTSTPTMLVVDVPAIPAVPPGGRTVLVRVSNPGGVDSVAIRVAQAQPSTLSAQLMITLSGTPAAALNPGDHVFVFDVFGISNMADTYDLLPSITPAGWSVQIVDAAGAPTSSQITIPLSPSPGGTTREVRVRVTIPAGTAGGTTGRLRLTVRPASRHELAQSSGFVDLVVGATAPPPQDEIRLSLDQAFNPATVSDGVIQVPAGQMARIDFTALVRDAASYTIALSVTPGSAAWQPELATESPFTTSMENTPMGIMTGLTPTSAAPDAEIVLRVAKADDSTVFSESRYPIRRT
jgi:hypothetical protein